MWGSGRFNSACRTKRAGRSGLAMKSFPKATASALPSSSSCCPVRWSIASLATKIARLEPVGSVALKLAWIAAGRADLWVSAAPKSEWDVCAGDLLVREAGGVVTSLDGNEDVVWQPNLVASANAKLHERVLESLRW